MEEVLARLAEAQKRHPDAEVRRGSGDGWELWPPRTAVTSSKPAHLSHGERRTGKPSK